MCQKRQRRCPTLLEIRKEALKEWASAETLHEVLTCWGRLRGRTTSTPRLSAISSSSLARSSIDSAKASRSLSASTPISSEQKS
jgi:hypothetical protein